ncbi:MAG: hypothetical protein ACJ74Y_18315 [Bryobacteraceae bacterium]
MLRAGFRLMVPLALIALSTLSSAKAQMIGFGWGGYAFPQYGYAYGCPPVYYQPYCSSYVYGYPYTLPGPWAGNSWPSLYWGGGYYPYRLGYYGYGTRFSYGPGLRYPLYRAASPAFRGYGGYRPGYMGYRGAAGSGSRGQFYGGGSRFAGGGMRGGGFRGSGRR